MKIRLKKYKSSTLLYTILVAFIIFIVLLSFIQIGFLSNQFLNREILKNKLNSNIQSALNILLERSDYINKKEIALYENHEKIIIESKMYGAYKVIKLSANSSNITVNKTYLIGTQNEQEKYAIILPEKNNELSLSGNAIIKGDCLLPKLGVKQSIINGISFIGDRLIDGKIFKSPNNLPKENTELSFIKKDNIQADSTIYFKNCINIKEITRKFSENKLIIYSNDDIIIENMSISGNIFIVSERSIQVRGNSGLSDIVLYSPFVKIEENFEGNLQIFARDSVSIAKNVKLKYPSFIGLFPSDYQQNASIHLKENSVIGGSVFGLDKAILSIENNAKIFGSVYIKNKTQLKGKVYGTIITENFALKTGLNEYKDVIQNGEVNINKRPSLWASGFIFENYNKIKLIKELE